MLIKIPDENILELKSKIKFVLGRKKVTLRDLQSLCGSLAFCSKALIGLRVRYLNCLLTVQEVSQKGAVVIFKENGPF